MRRKNYSKSLKQPFVVSLFLLLILLEACGAVDLKPVLRTTTLAQKYIDKNGFKIEYQNLDRARIRGVKISAFSVSESFLSDFDARESTWKNGVFKNTKFDRVYFDKAYFENVVFENCKITRTNFFESRMVNVKFVNCEIEGTSFTDLIDSNIEIIDSTLKNNDGNFKGFFEAQVKLRLIGTTIENTNFVYLKKGSSVYMENSKNIKSHYTQSSLDFFKIINSKISKSSLADAEITNISVQNSNIGFSLHDAKVENTIIDNSFISGLSAIKTIGKVFLITNCKNSGKVSFFDARIDSISLANCDFDSLHPMYVFSNAFFLENASIVDADFTEAKIKKLTMKSVTFTEKAEFTDFKPGKKILKNVKKGSNLKLITDGSTIKF